MKLAISLSARLPITRDLTLAYALSLVVAVLMAVVSAAGLVFGSAGLYGVDSKGAAGVTPSTVGVLVPGFLAHDAFNLIVGLPILLGSLWLARRGSLIGLLLWPGALFYVLYTYAQYLVGAPFSALFLPYVALVALSAYTTIGLVASVDGDAVRQRLAGVVSARTVGGILVGLAFLTLAQDAGGAVATALAGGAPIDPRARHVWTVDLAVEVPAVLAGGVLLWRRQPLGYVAGAGLLLQFGLTPVALAAILALQPLQPLLAGSPIDAATIAGLLIFGAVSFVPLAFFVRGAGRRAVAPQCQPRWTGRGVGGLDGGEPKVVQGFREEKPSIEQRALRKKRRVLMDDPKVRRWTGAFGVTSGILLVAALPIYLVRGTPPRLEDAAAFTEYVTRNNSNFLMGVLVDTLYIVGFLVFLAGLRHLIRQARPDYEWATTLVFGVGLVQAAVTLVGDTLIAGAALDTFNQPGPTVVRALTVASLAVFGVIGPIMTTLFLASASYAILATRALPGWIGWLGYVVTILNLAVAPSVYGGVDFLEATVAGGSASHGVYSYVSPVTGLAYLVWLFSAAISMMVVKREAAAPTPVQRR